MTPVVVEVFVTGRRARTRLGCRQEVFRVPGGGSDTQTLGELAGKGLDKGACFYSMVIGYPVFVYVQRYGIIYMFAATDFLILNYLPIVKTFKRKNRSKIGPFGPQSESV